MGVPGSLEETLAGRMVVVHQGALGDFLLALPILEALYRAYPRLRFDLWSKPDHLALLAEKPYVGKILSLDDAVLVPFFHDVLWKTAKIPPFLEDVQAVLIFGQAGSRLLGERLSTRLPCPVHWIQSFPGPGLRQHVRHFLLDQCLLLGWSLEEVLPEISPSACHLASVREHLRRENVAVCGKPLLIHPGSGGLRKVWPLRNWWMLLQFLRESYPYPVFLTLGPADDWLRDFAHAAKTLGVPTLDTLTLPLLAAWLSQGQLFVGSDSGVSHLAAAVGIPAVVIFGPTDPVVWAPRGAHVHVVRETWEESEVLAWHPAARPTALNSSLRELIGNLLPAG
jgi:heptosyltransferase III